MNMMEPGRSIRLSDLVVPPPRDPLEEDVVEKLVKSISYGGMIAPLVVYWKDGKPHLAAGHHRLEALRRLHETSAHFVLVLEADAEYWSHAENFVRRRLTTKQFVQSGKFMLEHAERVKGQKFATAAEARIRKPKEETTVCAATVAPQNAPTKPQFLAQQTGISERHAQRITSLIPHVNEIPNDATMKQALEVAKRVKESVEMAALGNSTPIGPKVSSKRYSNPEKHLEKAAEYLELAMAELSSAEHDISSVQAINEDVVTPALGKFHQKLKDLGHEVQAFMEIVNAYRS